MTASTAKSAINPQSSLRTAAEMDGLLVFMAVGS